MKTRSKFIILIAILSFVILGFIRDSVFVQVNAYLGFLRTGNQKYLLVVNLGVLEYFTYYPLYYTKFILTFLFTLLYLGLSVLVIKTTYQNPQYTKITMLFYFVTFILSLLIYVSGYVFTDIYKAYALSRYIMGVLQSPIACILLFFGFKLIK